MFNSIIIFFIHIQKSIPKIFTIHYEFSCEIQVQDNVNNKTVYQYNPS